MQLKTQGKPVKDRFSSAVLISSYVAAHVKVVVDKENGGFTK
jgi:hypothetical protein